MSKVCWFGRKIEELVGDTKDVGLKATNHFLAHPQFVTLDLDPNQRAEIYMTSLRFIGWGGAELCFYLILKF